MCVECNPAYDPCLPRGPSLISDRSYRIVRVPAKWHESALQLALVPTAAVVEVRGRRDEQQSFEGAERSDVRSRMHSGHTKSTDRRRLRPKCRHSLATFAPSSSKVRQSPLAHFVANWLSDGPALRLIGRFDIGGRLQESETQEISPISRRSFGLYFQSR